MLDIVVLAGQFLSLTGLLYGLMLSFKNREGAELRKARAAQRRARGARHGFRTHHAASRAAMAR